MHDAHMVRLTCRASPDSSADKKPACVLETPVMTLGRRDPLEKGEATLQDSWLENPLAQKD